MALSKIEVPSLDVGQLGNRNLLINSEFRVNQRGITSLTGNSGESKFLADRWITYCNAVDWSASIQEVTLPDGTVTNSLKTVATTTSAGAFFHPYQKVETYGKDYLQGKKVVLSAWVRTNVAGQFIRICDSINCYLLGTMIPADGQWHKVSAVHTIPTSMNTGANNFIQFQPLFNTVSLATNDYCEFALPQMELGYSEPTPFEHRSYGEELALCQRYFYAKTREGSGSNHLLGMSYWSSTTSNECVLQHPVHMRSAPSLSVDTIGDFYGLIPQQAWQQASAVSLNEGGPNTTKISFTCASNGSFSVDGRRSSVVGIRGDSGRLKMDAEL